MNTHVHVLKSTCTHAYTEREHMQLCKGLSGSIFCICLHRFCRGFSVLRYAKQVCRKLKEKIAQWGYPFSHVVNQNY